MCGIAGVIGKVDELPVQKMIQAQIHRGPDGKGIWSDKNCLATFGHCRLSIIDTSKAGHQPMSYCDGRLWITFNGELYNFYELRKELQTYGHKFKSRSDTEVVLASYLQWGTNCIKRFRGMFAFAIADKYPPKGAPSFILVRDRFGIKTLLYFKNKSKIWFASELKGLLASNNLNRRISRESLLDFLSVGSVYQPRTIFSEVKSLPPGHWMEIRGKKNKLVKYWDIHDETSSLRKKLKNVSFNDAKEELFELLIESAKYNLISDVPVGAFLSGGIDSTVVTGLMGEISPNKVKAFSVGFDKKVKFLTKENMLDWRQSI